MKGKALKHVSRPILTPDRKAARIQWYKDRQAQINDASNPFYVAFLDEKWFYTRSNRKKAKYLPLGDNEEPGADELPQLTTVSRRFAAKVSTL
jgi:hypothetical protein